MIFFSNDKDLGWNFGKFGKFGKRSRRVAGDL